VAVLALAFLGNTFGPPPSSERALAFGALGLWLFVPWSYWVDRHRVVTGQADAANRATPAQSGLS
jgi:hypothetical protein